LNHKLINSLQKVNTSVIILAAGKSERMDFPKPFLPYNSEKNFLFKIIEEYIEFGCSQIVVVVNRFYEIPRYFFDFNNYIKSFKFVVNDNPELDRFFSVKLGSENLINTEYCFIQNVDNPFVNNNLLNSIFEKRISGKYVVPQYQNQRGHPVLLSKIILESLMKEKNLSGNLRVFLGNFEKIIADVDDENILVNINTKEDYNKYFPLSEDIIIDK
jgi:molybdenum cofactor cytidylyltransferase